MLGALAAIGGTTRSIENPRQPLTYSAASATAGDLWSGGGASGDPMRLSAGLRSITVLASAVAGCPLKITDKDGDEVTTYAWKDTRPLDGTYLFQGGRTQFETWETITAHLATRGNAYVFKQRNKLGDVVALIPIHPDRVVIEIADGSAIGIDWVKKFNIDGKHPLTTWDVMHIPGLSMDGIKGLSVIEQLRRTFELAENAEIVADKLYRNGLLTNHVLKVKDSLDEEKASILKARWQAKVGGIGNAHEPLILDNEGTVEHLTLSPSDAQFLQTRQFSTTEIARIFGLPGWIINDQEKSTSWGSGMEQQFAAFVVLSLQPYFQRIEQRITRELLKPGDQAKFKIEGLLRGDSKSRAAFYASGIQHGWLVDNEVRKREDLPPVPWGNEPYLPFNKAASDQDAATDDDQGEDGDDE